MKYRILLPTIIAALLSTACESPRNSMTRVDLWGDPATTAAAERTIVIAPNAGYVNVIGGETINFVAGDKSFAWKFDGITEGYRFDLNRIAPPGMLDHRVIAYVDPNPQFPNGR